MKQEIEGIKINELEAELRTMKADRLVPLAQISFQSQYLDELSEQYFSKTLTGPLGISAIPVLPENNWVVCGKDEKGGIRMTDLGYTLHEATKRGVRLMLMGSLAASVWQKKSVPKISLVTLKESSMTVASDGRDADYLVLVDNPTVWDKRNIQRILNLSRKHGGKYGGDFSYCGYGKDSGHHQGLSSRRGQEYLSFLGTSKGKVEFTSPRGADGFFGFQNPFLGQQIIDGQPVVYQFFRTDKHIRDVHPGAVIIDPFDTIRRRKIEVNCGEEIRSYRAAVVESEAYAFPSKNLPESLARAFDFVKKMFSKNQLILFRPDNMSPWEYNNWLTTASTREINAQLRIASQKIYGIFTKAASNLESLGFSEEAANSWAINTKHLLEFCIRKDPQNSFGSLFLSPSEHRVNDDFGVQVPYTGLIPVFFPDLCLFFNESPSLKVRQIMDRVIKSTEDFRWSIFWDFLEEKGQSSRLRRNIFHNLIDEKFSRF